MTRSSRSTGWRNDWQGKGDWGMTEPVEPQVVYFRMCDEDRERFGGPEWGQLDVTRVMDSRAGWLERIERQAGGFPPS